MVERVAVSQRDELRRCIKLAMQALSAFGDTEEGVNTAYTTLKLALEQTTDSGMRSLSGKLVQARTERDEIAETLRHVASRANATLAKIGGA